MDMGISAVLEDIATEIKAIEGAWKLSEKQDEKLHKASQLIDYWKHQTEAWQNGSRTRGNLPSFTIERRRDPSGRAIISTTREDQTARTAEENARETGATPCSLQQMIYWDHQELREREASTPRRRTPYTRRRPIPVIARWKELGAIVSVVSIIRGGVR
ncbi:hypothetical protein R1sor_018672 [Riccia sorocarpa]|uniref:Uncharacterized protein n=1 Tax=Riccia sorocarpa TaxID=122646 RepID=A0ABD3IAC6_9MARC